MYPLLARSSQTCSVTERPGWKEGDEGGGGGGEGEGGGGGREDWPSVTTAMDALCPRKTRGPSRISLRDNKDDPDRLFDVSNKSLSSLVTVSDTRGASSSPILG